MTAIKTKNSSFAFMKTIMSGLTLVSKLMSSTNKYGKTLKKEKKKKKISRR